MARAMARKKRLEELASEIAALEAELAALEGRAPPPATKLPPGLGEAEAPEEARPRGRREKRRRRREAAEQAAPPEAPEPEAKPKRGLRLRALRRKEEPPRPTPEEAPEAGAAAPAPPPDAPQAPGAPEPAEEEPERRRRLPFGRARAEAQEAELEEAGPRLAWRREGAAWRLATPGPTRVEVVRRRLDAAGEVVAEETVGEEVVEAPEEPRRGGLFGALRGAGAAGAAGAAEAPEATEAEPEAPPRRRRGRVAVPLVILVVAVLVAAVVLPAVGVDPLGTGPLLGVGAGAEPEAVLALGASVAAVGQSVTFDASGSRDPGGRALEHSWDFGDGSGARGAVVSHAYEARGTYTVTLTVRNEAGREATASASLLVVAPPQARIGAELGGQPLGGANAPVEGEEVAFDGAGSTAEGGVRAFEWHFGDGATATGPQARHAFDEAGGYRVTLRVEDGHGLRGNASLDVFVGLGSTTAGEAPVSLQARQAVNHTVEVAEGAGGVAARPVQVRALLIYEPPNATGPVPLDPLQSNVLTLTVYDAGGTAAGSASGPGAEVEVGVAAGEEGLGAWSVEVSRPQGGAQPIPYELEVRVRYGPA